MVWRIFCHHVIFICRLPDVLKRASCEDVSVFSNTINTGPMNKDDLSKLVNELNALVSQFRFEEALDRFYDEHIVSVENENPPTVGLPAYRASAKQYLESISNNSATLLNVIVSDDMSVTEWHFKFDHKVWGRWDSIQLSLQRWRNGKIVHERHHYNR